MIMITKWKDNDRNADLRETMITGANEFSVTKEARGLAQKLKKRAAAVRYSLFTVH